MNPNDKYWKPDDPRLKRIPPTDFKHVQKYLFRAVAPKTVANVEDRLSLPYWHWQHDQGREGACVGFALSFMMSILNEQQARAIPQKPYVHKYNSRWLWSEAKRIDEWPETNPGDDNGTSVRAGCDVLRTLGHQRILGKVTNQADISQGIKENRWAITVDEIRTAISQGIPVVLGIDWMSNFDNPKLKGRDYWIGEGDLGYVRGGHAICVYGASDKRQAFALKNSWGKSYPLVWIPYKVVGELIQADRYGEACLVTDR